LREKSAGRKAAAVLCIEVGNVTRLHQNSLRPNGQEDEASWFQPYASERIPISATGWNDGPHLLLPPSQKNGKDDLLEEVLEDFLNEAYEKS
jgi:hypothetical protein